MEELPLLVLETVCEYLGCCEPTRSSLWAFASTSRTCRAVARRELFSRVLIRTDTNNSWTTRQEDMMKLEKIFEAEDCRRYVRTLKIGGQWSTGSREEDIDEEGLFTTFPMPRTSLQKLGPTRLKDWEPYQYRWLPTQLWAWGQLARLISGLVALTDLIWASKDQVPHCILSVLHERLPRCRLHVHTFDIRIFSYHNASLDIDDDEYLLATSPCLYSVIAPYHSTMGYLNSNQEAVLHMAQRLAPGLKHVRIWDRSRPCPGSQRRELDTNWTGFPSQTINGHPDRPRTKGQLETLIIDASGDVDAPQLRYWQDFTDFSHLRRLKLGR